jgi:3-dehydroquinate synthase
MHLDCVLDNKILVKTTFSLLYKNNSDLNSAVAGRKALFITTPTVFHLYGQALLRQMNRCAINGEVKVLPLTERTKDLDSVVQVCGLAQELRLDRRAVLVAFGGGVCSDVTTFAASMVRRGIAHVRIPTTLVGQVDAGVGLKGGVNFRDTKNYLGCFHPPDAVLVDRAFLRTLPAREIRQGMAEIVKVALVRDADLFSTLERFGGRLLESRLAEPDGEGERVIRRAIELMLEELEPNPYEDRGLARLVDMGHSFSPQIEAASAFAVPHGDAVAIDMALTCMIAAELGLLAAGDALRVVRLLAALGLPTDSPLLDLELCRASVRACVLHRGGELNLVVPTAVGRAGFLRAPSDLPEEVLARSLGRLRRLDRDLPGDAAVRGVAGGSEQQRARGRSRMEETRHMAAAGSAADGTVAPRSRSRRHYRFEDADLRATVAHGGAGEILTRRVEEATPQGIGAANFVDLTIVPPGTSIGVHTHGPGDEEIYVVVSGRGRMRLDGEEFAVGPGDVVVNRRCGTHGLVNTGEEDLRLVVVEIPAGPGPREDLEHGGRRTMTAAPRTASSPAVAGGPA